MEEKKCKFHGRYDRARCSNNVNHIKVNYTRISVQTDTNVRTLLINYSAKRKKAKSSQNFLKRVVIDVLWNHSILRMRSIFLGKDDNFSRKF